MKINNLEGWRERFKREFLDSEVSDLDGKQVYYLNDKAEEITPLLDFISDLRKYDEEELIKMLKDYVYQQKELHQLIKDYYNK
jgi:hypothetical protein